MLATPSLVAYPNPVQETLVVQCEACKAGKDASVEQRGGGDADFCLGRRPETILGRDHASRWTAHAPSWRCNHDVRREVIALPCWQ